MTHKRYKIKTSLFTVVKAHTKAEQIPAFSSNLLTGKTKSLNILSFIKTWRPHTLNVHLRWSIHRSVGTLAMPVWADPVKYVLFLHQCVFIKWGLKVLAHVNILNGELPLTPEAQVAALLEHGLHGCHLPCASDTPGLPFPPLVMGKNMGYLGPHAGRTVK